MDISIISVILSSLTAFAAVIGQIISAVITVRSRERTKRYEIYAPKVYSTVQRLTAAYSSFPNRVEFTSAGNQERDTMTESACASFKELSASALELMSLLPDMDIHNQVIVLLESMDSVSYTSEEQDLMFHNLTLSISWKLASDVSKIKKRNIKNHTNEIRRSK